MYVLDLYRKYRFIDKKKIDSFLKYHFRKIESVLSSALEMGETNEQNLFGFYHYLFIKLMNFDDECKKINEYNDFLDLIGADHLEKDDYVNTRDKMLSGDYDDQFENYFSSAFEFYFKFCKDKNKIKNADSLLDFSLLMLIKYNKELDDVSFDLDHTIDIMLDKKKEIIGDYNNNVIVINNEDDFNHYKENIYSLLNKYQLVYLVSNAKYNIDYTDSKYNGEVSLSIDLVFESGGEGFLVNYIMNLTYDSNLNLNDIENMVSDFFNELGEKKSYFYLDAANFVEENYRVRYVINPSMIMNIKYENKDDFGYDQIRIYFDPNCTVGLPDTVSVTFFASELMAKYNFVEDFDDLVHVNKNTLNNYVDKGYEFIFDLNDDKKIEEAFKLYEHIKEYLDW